MAAKDITTLQLTPSQTAASLRHILQTEVAAFVWGPPGIAKSAILRQVADRMGIAFIDLRLSQMEPTDLRGIPHVVDVGGVTGISWAAPHVLPRDINFNKTIAITNPEPIEVTIPNPVGSNDIHYVTNVSYDVVTFDKGLTAEIVEETPGYVTVALRDANGDFATGSVRVKAKGAAKGILGLEEFNSAPPSVQAASYQLVLDRRLGEYIVPKGIKIVALGNRDTDKGVTYKMPEPIKNRFDHLEMRADFGEWQVWAAQHNVHPDVVGYLSAFEGDLFQFDPGSAARGFPTPRSWHFVSQILNADEDSPDIVLRALITGAVGDAVAAKFLAHREAAQTMPHPEDILSGKIKTLADHGLKDLSPSLSYALVTALAYKLKANLDELDANFPNKAWKKNEKGAEFYERADRLLAFMLANLKAEINIMAARLIIGVYKIPLDPTKVKSLMTFANKYKQFIVPGT